MISLDFPMMSYDFLFKKTITAMLAGAWTTMRLMEVKIGAKHATNPEMCEDRGFPTFVKSKC